MTSAFLISRLLPVPHGFSTRSGGVSEGPYATLNLGAAVGDDLLKVQTNLGKLSDAAKLSVERLFTVNQVHGDRVLKVNGRPKAPAAPEGDADALFTETADAWVGVKTADCVPILIVDPDEKRVAAVHSGWRGTDARISARAVEALVREGGDASRLLAAVGPAIGPCCYAVSEALAQRFSSHFGAHVVRASDRGGQTLDLPRAVAQTLMDAGLSSENVDVLHRCTSCESETFFSHRRDQGRTGRHVSFVACCF